MCAKYLFFVWLIRVSKWYSQTPLSGKLNPPLRCNAWMKPKRQLLSRCIFSWNITRIVTTVSFSVIMNTTNIFRMLLVTTNLSFYDADPCLSLQNHRPRGIFLPHGNICKPIVALNYTDIWNWNMFYFRIPLASLWTKRLTEMYSAIIAFGQTGDTLWYDYLTEL